MLPIIAALFDTSIDNLMGYAKECSTKEREEFSAEVTNLETSEKILRYREMLQNYPNDVYLQFGLANLLYKFVKKWDDMQCGAKRLLALLSAKNGDLEDAMNYVNELPSVYCGREIMAIQILQGVSFRKALHEWLLQTGE